MADYFLAPAGKKLWDEVRGGRWPDRDDTSDGWIGDASHQAHQSDHNPAWDEPAPFTGIVRAVDFDVGGWPALDVRDYLLDRCRRGIEHRVAYVISNRTIWSATYGWVPKPYTGESPHTEHTHYSLKHDRSNFDETPWLTGFGAEQPAPPDQEDDDMAKDFIVPLGGAQWLVSHDLKSRTGIRTATDLRNLAATGQYIIGFPMTATQMAAIPIAAQVEVTNLEELMPPPIDEPPPPPGGDERKPQGPEWSGGAQISTDPTTEGESR